MPSKRTTLVDSGGTAQVFSGTAGVFTPGTTSFTTVSSGGAEAIYDGQLGRQHNGEQWRLPHRPSGR